MTLPKAIVCGPLAPNAHFPLKAFGTGMNGTVLVMTTDRKKANIAGWELVGTLFTQGDGIFIETQPFGEVQAAQVIDLYEQLTSRTAGLTGRHLRGLHVGFVGTGASVNLIKACARTGIERFSFWDIDVVEVPNVGRTAYDLTDLTANKTRAAHRHVLNINPNATVFEYTGDFMEFTDEELEAQMTPCDAIVVGTDAQQVQLRGNRLGYRLGKRMIFPGFYNKAAGGEIVVVAPPGPCYRCQVRSRFEDNEYGSYGTEDLKAESGLIFDCDHLDTIVGKLLMAMLLETRIPAFKRIFEHAAKNSLIFCKHEPDFLLEGEDIFGQFFGDSEIAFAYETLWFDPSGWRKPDCPVCGG